MKAVVLKNPFEVSIEERPFPQPSPNEVRIRVSYVGYCGTDIMVWQGKYKANYPIIPGHEFSGMIDAIGENVANLKVGDLVVAEASYPCHKCDLCLSNRAEFCRNRIALGRTRDGAMAEYIIVPAEIVHKIPKEVDLMEAQSLVGLACAIRAVRHCGSAVGKDAAVIGSGHSAMLILQVLKAGGINKLALIGGKRISRLRLAEELGADLAISYSSADLNDRLREFSPEGFDIVIEASGSASTIPLAINMVKPGGKIIVFSTYKERASNIPLEELYYKEITIQGSRAGSGEYQTASALLASGKVKVKPMITHVVEINEAAKGFEIASSNDEKVFRVVMKIGA
ncbi:MAG: alcohol dehydrogenase catalytic domain-containing protein [Synergistetes bacterium]|nr:alcohol dehydrogenase catalytic domain-containing protein [Synergistota bacterium]